MPRLRERHQRVLIIVAPAIEVTLQNLSSSAPTVAMLTPETRARMASRKEERLSEHPGRYSYEIDCQSRTACGGRLARAQVDVVVGLRPWRVDREDDTYRSLFLLNGWSQEGTGGIGLYAKWRPLRRYHRWGGPEDVVAADHICR